MDSAEPLQVRYRNTRGDVVLYQINRVFGSAINRVMFAVVAVIFLVQEARDLAYDPRVGLLHLAVRFALLVGGVVVLTAFAVAVGTNPRKNRSVLTEHVITLTDSGVLEETEFNRSETYWRAVAGVERTSSYVHLFPTQLSAYVIPAAAFGSEQALATFVATARQRIREAREAGR